MIKTVLALSGTGALLGNSTFMTLNSRPLQEKVSVAPFAEKEDIIWTRDNENYLEYSTPFGINTSTKFYFYREVNLGWLYEWDRVKSFSAYDPESSSFTGITWGWETFSGIRWRDQKDLSVDLFKNIDLGKVQDPNARNRAIRSMVDFRMGDGKHTSGVAWLEWMSWIGFSHFIRTGEHFISVFGVHEIESGWTFTGGVLSTGLGKGVTLNLAD